VMQIDTSMEYWQFHASLVTHDARGRPLALPPNVRYYAIASGQHAPGVPRAGASVSSSATRLTTGRSGGRCWSPSTGG